ncbi:hypothetical protein FQN57_004167 [Myotisia sp. PD_48]|nr:hypothetical protein FQN57_004167 [Myotisia sp. PD_48]
MGFAGKGRGGFRPGPSRPLGTFQQHSQDFQQLPQEGTGIPADVNHFRSGTSHDDGHHYAKANSEIDPPGILKFLEKIGTNAYRLDWPARYKDTRSVQD